MGPDPRVDIVARQPCPTTVVWKYEKKAQGQVLSSGLAREVNPLDLGVRTKAGDMGLDEVGRVPMEAAAGSIFQGPKLWLGKMSRE